MGPGRLPPRVAFRSRPVSRLGAWVPSGVLNPAVMRVGQPPRSSRAGRSPAGSSPEGKHPLASASVCDREGLRASANLAWRYQSGLDNRSVLFGRVIHQNADETIRGCRSRAPIGCPLCFGRMVGGRCRRGTFRRARRGIGERAFRKLISTSGLSGALIR